VAVSRIDIRAGRERLLPETMALLEEQSLMGRQFFPSRAVGGASCMTRWAGEKERLAEYRHLGHSYLAQGHGNENRVHLPAQQRHQQIGGSAFAQDERESGVLATQVRQDERKKVGAKRRNC